MGSKIRPFFWVTLFVLGACATGRQAATRKELKSSAEINISVAASDIEAARRVGAPVYAPQDFGRAENGLREARKRFKDGDFQGARADARLAIDAVRTARSKTEAAKTAESEKAAAEKVRVDEENARAKAKPAAKKPVPKKG